MNLALNRRSHVVIPAGMSPADRATLARMLLERGLEVSCRHDAPAGGDASPHPRVFVDDGAGTEPRTLRTIEAAGLDPASLVDSIQRESPPPAGTTAWKPWFPVIDYSRCTNCMQCLSFCLFDVYGVSADQKIQVQNQSNCKTECPACSRVCPEVAIMFPKYRHGPINGEDVTRLGELFPPEVIIAVDVGSFRRIHLVLDHVSPETVVVNIDHHPGNGGPERPCEYVDLGDPSVASTTMLTYLLLREAWPGCVTAKAATCLYVGLITDTGCFRFSNTNAETLGVGAELVALGADPGRLAENYMFRRRPQALRRRRRRRRRALRLRRALRRRQERSRCGSPTTRSRNRSLRPS